VWEEQWRFARRSRVEKGREKGQSGVLDATQQQYSLGLTFQNKGVRGKEKRAWGGKKKKGKATKKEDHEY